MEFRKATKEDVYAIVRLLADDELGAQRERFEEPLPAVYYEAFNAMESQVGNQIILAVENQKVIGCLQLTIIPGLARQGEKRAQIEGVRVDRDYRGREVGETIVQTPLAIVKSYICHLTQFTSDKPLI